MKKFVGNVNGKTFDNEAEFLNAAEAAMKNGEDNLSISSYYRVTDDAECDDNEKENVNNKPVDDPKFVSTYEYFLSGRNPDSETENGVEYKVSDELKNRIIEASNRDDIKKSVTFHLNKLRDNIWSEDRLIRTLYEKNTELQKQIEKNAKLIDEENDKLNDLKARETYYASILNTIDVQKAKEEKEKKEQEMVNEAGPSNETEERAETTDLKKKIQEEVKGKSVSSFLEMSALDFLKQLGFIK